MVRKRQQWRNLQYWLKPERLVFIDETGAKTNMARLRGRSLKGQRLHAAIERRIRDYCRTEEEFEDELNELFHV